MAYATSEEAIRQSLMETSIVTSRRRSPGARGWIAETSTGGVDAKPLSVQFLRARRLPGRETHAVLLETTTGMLRTYICYVEQSTSGDWQLVSASGGSANGFPVRAQPWAHLGGGGWTTRFYAGAYVDDQTVARVRLTSSNGVVLDDTVDHGVALFLAEAEVQVPMQAELYDARGHLISQHTAFA